MPEVTESKLVKMSRAELWQEMGEAIERLRVTYENLSPPRSKYQYGTLLNEVNAINFHLNWASDEEL